MQQSDWFTQSYTQYVDEIYRYIFFRVNQNKEVAEDLSSQTFLKAWRNHKNYDANKASIRTYFYRIAQNIVIDHYRTNKPTSEINELSAIEKPTSQSIEAEIFWQQAHEVLPGPAYEKMVLKYRSELRLQEIADISDTTVDAVKSSLKRARQQLKQMIESQIDQSNI